MVANHGELIFFLLTSPKCDLAQVEKAMFRGVASQFELIFDLLTIPNATWVSPKKRCFKTPKGLLNLFSASALAENAIS